MPKVQLLVQKGYGTMLNPAESLRTIDLGRILGPNENVRRVDLDDFEADDNGVSKSGPCGDPVITYESINFLVGKVLTVTDAMARDDVQRKAVKDLVTQAIWQWYEGRGKTDGLKHTCKTVLIDALFEDMAP